MSDKQIKRFSSFFIILGFLFSLFVIGKAVKYFYNEIGLIWTILYIIIAGNIYLRLNFSKKTNRPIMNFIGDVLIGGVYIIWCSINYEFPIVDFSALILAIIFNGLGEYLNYYWIKRKGLDEFYGLKYPEI